MAWDAYNSNVPPASSMVEGPSNLTPNLTSMPNPVGSAINAAKFFAGAAPLTSQIASKYGLTIADQSDLGKQGMNQGNVKGNAAAPIMTHVTPRKVHSQIKEGLPSVGQLYAPKLGGPTLGKKK